MVMMTDSLWLVTKQGMHCVPPKYPPLQPPARTWTGPILWVLQLPGPAKITFKKSSTPNESQLCLATYRSGLIFTAAECSGSWKTYSAPEKIRSLN